MKIARLPFMLLALLALAPAAFGSEDFGEFLMHHISNGYEWKVTPWGPTIHLPQNWLTIGGIDLSISSHVLLMLIAAALLVLLLLPSRKRGLAPTGRVGHALEAMVIFVRDQLVRPNFSEEDTRKWMPFFLTLFFFLFTMNYLALIPGVPSPTGNINFTGAMALMIFVLFNASGIARNGPVHYFTNLVPRGLPIAVLPLIALIEVIGLFTKTFALAVRLFANMTAGHVLILSLLGLIVAFQSYASALAFLPFTLFIYLIEILVAGLQAYVFTLLASLFVGMAVHQEH
jgi:F-type H+-transporting ATPase subunit a